MCFVHVHQTSTRTDIQTLMTSTPTAIVRRRCHTDNYGAGHGLQEKNTNKCSTPLNAECFNSSYKQKEDTKTRRKVEEETLATTKSAKRLKKKSAQMMIATERAALLSTTMKKAHQVIKTILKSGFEYVKKKHWRR